MASCIRARNRFSRRDPDYTRRRCGLGDGNTDRGVTLGVSTSWRIGSSTCSEAWFSGALREFVP
jgi:hypothetical protein